MSKTNSFEWLTPQNVGVVNSIMAAIMPPDVLASLPASSNESQNSHSKKSGNPFESFTSAPAKTKKKAAATKDGFTESDPQSQESQDLDLSMKQQIERGYDHVLHLFDTPTEN